MGTWLRSLWRNLVHSGRVERALTDEVRAYLDLLTDEKMALGMAPDAARRAARIELGGVDQVKEEVRRVRAGALLDQLIQDVRYSVRVLRRAPGFTTIAVLTLALGIGANTAIFSVVDALLLRPLPIADPPRVVALYGGATGTSSAFSYLDYLDYREQRQTLDGVAAWGDGNAAWFRNGGDLERAPIQIVSGNYFDVLGVHAALGRTFYPDEDAADGVHPVAVISQSLWRDRFGADPAVVGRGFTLNGRAFTVVGVAPRGFSGLDPGSLPDVWVPLAMLQALEPDWKFKDRNELWLHVVARLRDGTSIRGAEASLQPIATAIAALSGGTPPSVIARLIPASVALFDPGERASSLRLAWLLTAVVGFVLLIACANVANLLLARSAARRRELGVRLAIGATRGRLARQVVTESVLLALVGGAAGLAVAEWTTRLLVTLAPAATIPPGVDIALDARVVTFAVLLSVATGVLFGVAPAWQSSRLDALLVIKGDAPGDRRRGGAMRRLLVVSQVALSIVLLVGAALFIRTLSAAMAVKSGYDTGQVLLTTVDFSVPKPGPAAALRIMQRAIEQVEAIPGVEAASFGQIVPFSGSFIGRTAVPEGQPATPPFPESTDAPYTVVSPGYFRTLGLPLRGRDFTSADDESAPRVVVINETMARRFWPDAQAIGKRLRLPLREPGPLYDVIGVVQDGKYRSLTEAQYPYLYLPLEQTFRPRVTLHVRTAGAPAAYAAQVRAALRAIAPDLPAYNVVTLEERMTRSLARERLIARLLTVFGAIALAIAAVGIYGVLAYSVARRTKELGLRMALGARSIDIVRMVVAHSLALVGAGVVLGIIAALLLTRFVATFLFGVTPTDPVAFGGAISVLVLVALVATYLPARRATRVDPLAALRTE